jgi:hypothetical protein
MSRVTLHLSAGPRRRTTTVSDTKTEDSRSIRMTTEELAEYLAAKEAYDEWQRKLSQHRRHGWHW